jgi:hypothetical protein
VQSIELAGIACVAAGIACVAAGIASVAAGMAAVGGTAVAAGPQAASSIAASSMGPKILLNLFIFLPPNIKYQISKIRVSGPYHVAALQNYRRSPPFK